MKWFDSIQKKKAEKREKKDEALFAVMLEGDESKKEKYLNMSCQEANSLFRDCCDASGYHSYKSDFSMSMWLKYSYDAPKGLAMQKREARLPSEYFSHTLQYEFIIESCLRYSVNKKSNPYLNVNYEGILIDLSGLIAGSIWKLIDSDIINPFEEDAWLFDKSFYEEAYNKRNYYPSDRTQSEVINKYKELFPNVKDMYSKVIFVKILIMLLVYQDEFREKLGIESNTDLCELFKRDGKFVELTEMLKIIDNLQTVLKFDRPSKVILMLLNSQYSSFDFVDELMRILNWYGIYEELTPEEEAASAQRLAQRAAERAAERKEKDDRKRAYQICCSCTYFGSGCRKVHSKEAIGCASYKPKKFID